MLIGEYYHSLDEKGRITIPSKFREPLGETFIMTKGLDKCLFIYPIDEWNRINNKLKELPLSNREARAFVRFFFSSANECKIDGQGRALIPINLREHAKMEKEVTIIGVSTRLELWSKDIWDSYNNDDNLSYDEIAEKMYELGI